MANGILAIKFVIGGRCMAVSAKWDYRFLALARLVSTWSKDPSTQVGAVIVTPDHRVVSLGYNGLPRGVQDSTARLHDRDTKYRLVLHAEENALLFADSHLLRGATLYTYPLPPCAPCASKLVQVGLGRVVTVPPTAEQRARWGADWALADEVLAEAGVEVDTLPGA